MTQTELAAALKISQPMVSKLVRAGMPKDLEGAIAWRRINLDNHLTVDYRRTRHPRHQAARAARSAAPPPAEPPPRDARERLDRARAEIAELDLAERRGELLRAAEVRCCREKQNAAFRQRMLAIPGKAALQIAPPGKVQEVDEILTAAIHEALRELSGVGDG